MQQLDDYSPWPVCFLTLEQTWQQDDKKGIQLATLTSIQSKCSRLRCAFARTTITGLELTHPSPSF